MDSDILITEEKIRCPKCGRGLGPYWNFCPICGTPKKKEVK